MSAAEPMSPGSIAKIRPSVTESKAFTYQSTSTSCLICMGKIFGEPKNKDVPMCQNCYSRSCQMDLEATRTYVFEPADHILDNIYLGPEGSTKDLKWLETNEIDRVLTVASHSAHLKTFPKSGVKYLQIDMDDVPTQDLTKPLTTALDFILSKRNTNILIHSVSGNSRAGAIVCAYVMATKKVGYDEALAVVRAKRDTVHPNSGFIKQLREYEDELKDRQVIPGRQLPPRPSSPDQPEPEKPALSQFYVHSFSAMLARRLKEKVDHTRTALANRQ